LNNLLRPLRLKEPFKISRFTRVLSAPAWWILVDLEMDFGGSWWILTWNLAALGGS
jgi:hypothetical protein